MFASTDITKLSFRSIFWYQPRSIARSCDEILNWVIEFLYLFAVTLSKYFSQQSLCLKHAYISKIVKEYDQEIPQSQTADNPVAPRGRAAQPSRDTKKTN